MQQPGLSAAVGFYLECVVVLPGDLQPSWNAHDCRRAVGFALVAFRLVLCRIPRIRDPASFGIQRNAGIVAFGRSNHAIEPVFADDTDPITREITRADSSGRGCGSA